MLVAFLALSAASITIDNISDGTELRYPLAMLRGSAEGTQVKANGVSFPVVGGKYIALVELKPGKNAVTLDGEGGAKRINLSFKPATNDHKVVPVWLVSRDGDGKHYTTFPNRPQLSKQKFDLMMKVLQSFTAEAMNDKGYGRKTFTFDLDANGMTKIKDFRLGKTTAELHAMTPNDTWFYIYNQMKSVAPEATSKWVTLLSTTDYDTKTRKASSHFALGGGALAAFGTGSMDFWPATLADLPKVWSDGARVDPAEHFEDSGNRGTVWANVATAYGATLHELGHTLGLPHTADRFCIMSRGFDQFNRRFMLTEPGTTFQPNEMSHWDPHFAARLNWNRWLQAEKREYTRGGGPTVSISGTEVVFKAPKGIRVIGAESDDRPAVWQSWSQADPPREATWSLSWLRNRVGGSGTYRITIMDDEGNQTTVEDKR